MNCFAVQKLSIIRGDLLLFKNLSFEINAGELLFVKGKNGSGKSTLLRTLLGLITPDEGQILWNKENINNLSIGEFMFYLGHQNGIKEEFSPRENLNFFWNFNDNTDNENNSENNSENNKNKDIILDALKAFSIEKKHNIPCKYLSQGQKRRVALSRLVLENRPIWILDEPFVALDTLAVEKLSNLIAEHINKNNGMVILTSHQEVSININENKIKELNM